MARALGAWNIKGRKNSVHNLLYGPRTRLIRGMYRVCSCYFSLAQANLKHEYTLYIDLALPWPERKEYYRKKDVNKVVHA